MGILGPTAFVTTWAVAGALRTGYSPTADAISELAEVGSSTAPFMNTAFIVFGLTAIPFARSVRHLLPQHGTTVAAVMIITGLTTVGAGFFQCSPGCPGPGAQAAVTDNGHAFMATVGYVALVASPLLVARATWSSAGWRTVSRLSIAAGVVASVGMLAWVLGLAGQSYGGLLQRGFNTLLDIWWAGLGIVTVLRGLGAPRSTSQARREPAART